MPVEVMGRGLSYEMVFKVASSLVKVQLESVDSAKFFH